jgi:hypothetical protein
MLTRINDDLYIDLSDILHFAILKNENKCIWVLRSFQVHAFQDTAEAGELIRQKLDEWLGLSNA